MAHPPKQPRSLVCHLRALALAGGLVDELSANLELPSGWPLSVNVDVTRGCNLRCVMCASDHGATPVVADEALWKGLADALPLAAELSVGCLHEPTLHPELPERLAELRAAAAATGWRGFLGLLTSGTLLTSALSDRLLDVGLGGLLLSIDTTDEATYARVRRPATWTALRPEVERLVRRARHRRVMLAVRTMIMRETAPHLVRSTRELVALGLRCFNIAQVQVAPDPNLVVGRDHHGLEEALATLRALARAEDLELDLPASRAELPTGAPIPVLGDGDVWDEHRIDRGRPKICVVPWCKVRVDHEGWAYPCPHKGRPELAWGNLLQASLADIVNGALARRDRRRLLAGVAPDDACLRCPYGPDEGAA